MPWANGLSLTAAHTMPISNKPSTTSRIVRQERFPFAGPLEAGGTSSLTWENFADSESAAGTATGLPHLRQYCAPSGSRAPHLLQARYTSGSGDSTLTVEPPT